jgi:hypothetical protein
MALYIGRGLVYATAIAYSGGSINHIGVIKMSQSSRLKPTSPTLPKMQSKLFNAFQVEPFTHSLIFGKGLSLPTHRTISAIGMNAHAAKSAMGVQ